MQQRHLGKTGLKVSRLGLGTLGWAQETDEHEAKEELLTFVAAGGTLVDTAANYSEGESERLLGSLLGSAVPRDEVVVATKAGISWHGGVRRVDVSRAGLLRTLDASLARLGVDFIDLWQVQRWSDEVPFEETLSALDFAVSSGRVAYAGISNYNGWQTARAATWQEANHSRVRLASTQVEYSLLNRDPEHDVLAAASACGMGVLAWSPLGRGALTGKYQHSIPGDSRAADDELAAFVAPYLGEPHRGVVSAVVRAAQGLGHTPVEVALAWVRDRPGMTSAIVGARNVHQLKQALSVEDVTLPPEIAAALNDASAHL